MTATGTSGPLTPTALGALARWQGAGPVLAVTAAWCALVLLPHEAAHGSLAGWALMTVAMMVPLVAPVLNALAARVYRAQQPRVWAWAALGYGAVWMAAGAVVIPLAGSLHHLAGHDAGAAIGSAAFAAAALWQMTPAKRAALRRCHVLRALPVGHDIDSAALLFGLRHGSACLGACGPLMAAVAIAGGPLWIMAWVSALLLAERAAHRAPMRAAAVLVALLSATLAVEELAGRSGRVSGHVNSHADEIVLG